MYLEWQGWDLNLGGLIPELELLTSSLDKLFPLSVLQFPIL